MKRYIKILLCVGVQVNMHSMHLVNQRETASMSESMVDNDTAVNALRNNNHQVIQVWCEAGMMPNEIRVKNENSPLRSYIRLSPLTYAIEHDAWEVARILLRCPSIDINKKTEDVFLSQPFFARSPLMGALEKKSEAGKRFLKILLQNRYLGINEHFVGGIPLIRAMRLNNIFAVEQLLNNDEIEVNKHYEGTTALIEAIVWNKRLAFDLLLRHRHIDVNMAVNGGKTPLVEAVIMNNVYAVEQLLKHPHIDVNMKVQLSEEWLTAEDLALKQRNSHASIYSRESSIAPAQRNFPLEVILERQQNIEQILTLFNDYKRKKAYELALLYGSMRVE